MHNHVATIVLDGARLHQYVSTYYHLAMWTTYAAARSASLGVAVEASAALGAGVVVRVDRDCGGLHFELLMYCFGDCSRPGGCTGVDGVELCIG
jgi:hypothetical protein